MEMHTEFVAVDPEQATVLFGAGVTGDAGGPTAWELITAIAEHFVADPAWRSWIADNLYPGGLRFETAMDELAFIADPELAVLGFLNAINPGPLHRVLARAAARGARLVTVNFENLAELALAAEQVPPWTIDAQQSTHSDRQHERGAVLKLHGTLSLNNGDAEFHPAAAPLHATITQIVAAGGGAGLAPTVEEQLRAVIDGRVLVVIGYSGSDDLDVMPSLARCGPSAVVWVSHDDAPPAPRPISDASPAVRGLLDQWESRGAKVTLASGRTSAILSALGWDFETESDATGATAAAAWTTYIRVWAERARYHDPSGLGWVAQLPASLGRFDRAHEALLASVPSDHPDGLWSRQRRLLELAENAYLRDSDRGEVRQLAEEARAVAAEHEDLHYVARAYHLIARSYLNAWPKNLNAAEDALRRAHEALEHAPSGRISADLSLFRARLLIARSSYSKAAETAADAAKRYQEVGELRLVSEALQVSGHALALNGDEEHAMARLGEAVRIADTGPYPERKIACEMVMAMAFADLGDTDLTIRHARSAINVAIATNHVGETSQAYRMLGDALSENGAFAEAAEAHALGLAAMNPQTQSLQAQLACGLAENLFHTGQRERAVEVLDANQQAIEEEPQQTLRAAAIRWRAGDGTEEEVLDAAVAMESAGAPPTAQTVFTVLRLGVPGPAAARYIEDARERVVNGGQRERLARLNALLQERD